MSIRPVLWQQWISFMLHNQGYNIGSVDTHFYVLDAHEVGGVIPAQEKGFYNQLLPEILV